MLKKKVLGCVIGISLFASNEFSFSYDVGPFYGGVNSAIKAALPEPFIEGYDLATGFFGGLLPHPNIEGEILYDLDIVQNDLAVIEKQMAAVLQLEETTISLIIKQDNDANLLALKNIVNNAPAKSGILNSSGIISINSMYESFYNSGNDSKAVFPITGDYYSYAKTLCDDSNGCTKEGTTGKRAITLLTGETDSNTLKGLLESYQNSLQKPSTEGWEDSDWARLNKAYSDYLNGTDGDLSDINEDYVAKYIKATSPIISLEVNYYQALMMLYNLQAFQLAFYYVNPDLIKNSPAFAKDVNGSSILSDKTGQEGYEEAMQNLTQAYVHNFLSDKGNYTIMNIFGGRYVTESGGKFNLDPDYVYMSSTPLTNLKTMNAYIAGALDNNTLNLFNSIANNGGAEQTSLFRTSGYGLLGPHYDPATAFLNNCQIINAQFPADKTITELKFICNVEQDGNEYSTSVLRVSVPYKIAVNSEDSTPELTVGMNNLDLAYDSSLKHYYITASNDNNFFASNTMIAMDRQLSDLAFDGAYWYNPAYVFGCHGGSTSKGQCHIAYSPTEVSFSNMVQFAYVPTGTNQQDARESCVLSSQSYKGNICIEQSFGLDGYTKFAYKDHYDHTHTASAASVYTYGLTLNGDVFGIQMAFPSATGRNELDGQKMNYAVASQEIMPFCLSGDPTCFREYFYYDKDGNYQVNGGINFDYAGDQVAGNGEVKLNYQCINPKAISSNGGDKVPGSMKSCDSFKFSSTIIPRYVFAKNNNYNQWLDSAAEGNPIIGEDVSTAYGLDLTFRTSTGPLTEMVVILQSDNGQYRLIYTGDNKNTGDNSGKAEPYSLVVQMKDGDGWAFVYDAYDYDKKPASEILQGESSSPNNIASVSFQNGNLTTYYYDTDWQAKTESTPYQIINSVENEYQSKGYRWIPDPYAYLHLNNNGHLDIVSSNDEVVTGNNLGYVLGSGQNILWANYWLGETKYWDKIQNPKLPPLNGAATVNNN
jgi:hypothetical protein